LATWPEYQQLARHLDQLAHDHAQHTAALAEGGQATAKTAQDLQPRIDEQRQRLDALARVLGRRVGQPPATFTGVTNPAEALRIAHEQLATADHALDQAERRAQQPALLPAWPTSLRNLVVYLAGALLAALAQYLLALDAAHLNQWTVLAWSYVGFPAAAWIAAYIIITAWGRPRAPAPAPPARSWEKPQPPPPPRRSARLGFAVCFLAMPLTHLLITHISPHLNG
jgi:hypothetical protein